MGQVTPPKTSLIGSPRARHTGAALFGLLVSVVSVILVARSVNLADAARIVASAAISPLIVALALMVVALGFRVLSCFVLLPDRGDGSRAGPARLVTPVLVGYLGNLVLPARLGELVRAYLIARREGMAIGGTLGSVALERIVDTAMLAIMAFVAAYVVGAAQWIIQGMGLIAGAGVLLVALLASVGLQPVVRLLRRFGAIHLLRAPIAVVLRVLEPFAQWSGGSHRRRAIVIAIGLSLAAWTCTAAMFWLVGVAVGANLSPAGTVLVMAVTVLATAIPSAPGYVGTFELAAVTVATSLGVPSHVAFALAVLAHVLGMLPTAVGGSLALMRLGGGLRRLSEAAAEELPAAGS